MPSLQELQGDRSLVGSIEDWDILKESVGGKLGSPQIRCSYSCAIDSNHWCPYAMLMKQQKEDIATIKTALTGIDLHGGLIKRISDIEVRPKKRWNPKDWGTLLTGIAALITAIYTYLNTIVH